MVRTADMVIIGAGIQGCSAALHYRQRGLSVVVVAKDHADRHASGVNAGSARRHCHEHLSLQKTPDARCRFDAFPLTGPGKIQKFALRERYLAGDCDGGTHDR